VQQTVVNINGYNSAPAEGIEHPENPGLCNRCNKQYKKAPNEWGQENVPGYKPSQYCYECAIIREEKHHARQRRSWLYRKMALFGLDKLARKQSLVGVIVAMNDIIDEYEYQEEPARAA
jgi:hypothetical protein